MIGKEPTAGEGYVRGGLAEAEPELSTSALDDVSAFAPPTRTHSAFIESPSGLDVPHQCGEISVVVPV